MSKAAKKRNQERRRSEKQKRKTANTARYASLVGTAQNLKKKGKRLKGKTTPGHPHFGYCGNSGCKKCFPILNLRHIRKTKVD